MAKIGIGMISEGVAGGAPPIRVLEEQMTSVPRARTSVYLGVCIVLIGLNLRTVFSSLSAILNEFVMNSMLDAAAITALTTLPITCLGVMAPLAPSMARRLGTERLLLVCSLLLTCGLFLRGAAALPAFIAGTCICGLAIGIVNVLLPAIVKRSFHRHLGLMNGLYTAAICASAALGAGLTYPLFRATGSLNLALGVWALPATAAVILLLPLAWRKGKDPEVRAPGGGPSVWRSSIAWSITVLMALQAMMSFSVFAWLTPILRERGLDAGGAGLLTALSIFLQIAGSLAAPLVAVRCREQHHLIGIAALLAGGGFALTACGPMELVWLWIVLIGSGQGSLTALALTLISLRTSDDRTAARLSGMTQCVGYGIGSSGTFIVGWAHGLTGNFTIAGLLMLGIGALAGGAGVVAGRNKILT